MERVGFIGLGNMGRPMAKNLVKAGYQVTVFDVVQASVEELKNEGAAVAATPKEVAANTDVIITMLPNSPHVESVVLGKDGVVEGAAPGTLLIDMSSISPGVSQKIAAEVGKKDIRMIDAPVSGGTVGAANGALAIMIGGEQADVDRAMPIFEVLGKKIVHLGKVGMGQMAKVCNQIVVGISFCAAAEAMTLGTKAGIKPELLQQVLNSGSAHSWAMNTRIPQVIEGNMEPGFMIDLQHKDLGLAVESGRDFHVPLNFASLAYQAYEAARNQGLGQKDHSAVIQVFERLANVEVRKEGVCDSDNA
jgi:2-hydroxy-3-oxopropionate reductase